MRHFQKCWDAGIGDGHILSSKANAFAGGCEGNKHCLWGQSPSPVKSGVPLQTTDSSNNEFIWKLWAPKEVQKLDLGEKAPEGFVAGITAQESCFYSTGLNELHLSLNCPRVCKPQWKPLLRVLKLRERALQDSWLQWFESKANAKESSISTEGNAVWWIMWLDKQKVINDQPASHRRPQVMCSVKVVFWLAGAWTAFRDPRRSASPPMLDGCFACPPFS